MQLQPLLPTSEPTNWVQTRKQKPALFKVPVQWCCHYKSLEKNHNVIWRVLQIMNWQLLPRNISTLSGTMSQEFTRHDHFKNFYMGSTMRHRLLYLLYCLQSPTCLFVGWVGTRGKCRASCAGRGRGVAPASESGFLQQSGLGKPVHLQINWNKTSL